MIVAHKTCLLAAAAEPPIHPIGWVLIVLSGLFVVGLAGLMIHSFWTNRRPDFRNPEQMLRHHVQCLLVHNDGKPGLKEVLRRFAELHRDLVPAAGSAESVQGEIVRCIDRLASEERRNGNLNWKKGYAQMTAFLKMALPDAAAFDDVALKEITAWLSLIESHGTKPQEADKVDAAFAGLIRAAVRFHEVRPELMSYERHGKG